MGTMWEAENKISRLLVVNEIWDSILQTCAYNSLYVLILYIDILSVASVYI